MKCRPETVKRDFFFCYQASISADSVEIKSFCNKILSFSGLLYEKKYSEGLSPLHGIKCHYKMKGKLHLRANTFIITTDGLLPNFSN